MGLSIVTGGTAGIGAAIVGELIQRGVDDVVALYGHDDEAAKRLSACYPDRVRTVRADLSTVSGIDILDRFVKSSGEGVDRLVLNTGVPLYRNFSELTMDEWELLLRTNLTIPLFLLQRLMPCLEEGSSVLVMGSRMGEVPHSTAFAYGVSKAGIIFASRQLVKELEPIGARVNAVAPGFIETRWQAGRSAESYERIERKIALHRFGTSEEVARMAVEVMDNEYMNGSVVDIDGGYDYF